MASKSHSLLVRRNHNDMTLHRPASDNEWRCARIWSTNETWKMTYLHAAFFREGKTGLTSLDTLLDKCFKSVFIFIPRCILLSFNSCIRSSECIKQAMKTSRFSLSLPNSRSLQSKRHPPDRIAVTCGGHIWAVTASQVTVSAFSSPRNEINVCRCAVGCFSPKVSDAQKFDKFSLLTDISLISRWFVELFFLLLWNLYIRIARRLS